MPKLENFTITIRGALAERLFECHRRMLPMRQEPARLSRHSVAVWLFERGLEAKEAELAKSVPPELAR